MILQVLAVYDSKARAYLTPWFSSQVAVGVRTFMQAANTPGHQICEHPEDFTIMHLGTFNDDNAKFDLKDVPINLGMASQYKTLGSPDVQSKIA